MFCIYLLINVMRLFILHTDNEKILFITCLRNYFNLYLLHVYLRHLEYLQQEFALNKYIYLFIVIPTTSW